MPDPRPAPPEFELPPLPPLEGLEVVEPSAPTLESAKAVGAYAPTLESAKAVGPEGFNNTLLSSGTDIVPILLESDAPDQDMPIFRRIGTDNVIPYCWISARDDADILARSVKGSEIETEGAVSKPIIYGGVLSFKAINEYGKHPHIEFELSDPEYQSPKGTDGSLIDRLKVGKVVDASFGYKGAYITWRPLKVTSVEIAFKDGSAYLTVKAIHGGSFKDYSTSEVYTNLSGKTGLEVLAAALGYSVTKLNILQTEYEQIKRAEAVNGSVGLSYFLKKSGLHYRFDPSTNDFVVETPFKQELVKRGQKPMKVTYGYPISTIADLEYRKDYPKKGGSNNGGKRQLADKSKKQVGVDVNSREIVVYVRGTFPIKNSDGTNSDDFIQVGPSAAKGSVFAPSEQDVAKQYPLSEGYIIEENTQYISLTGGKAYNIKRVFNVNDLVESEVKVGQDISILSQQGIQGTYYIYTQDSFYYEQVQAQDYRFSPQVNSLRFSYRQYKAAPASAGKPPTKPAPKNTEKRVQADGQSFVERPSVSIGTAYIEKGYEAGDLPKSDPQYDERQELENLKHLASSNPNKYRLTSEKSDQGTLYYISERVPVTDKPEEGAVADKEQGAQEAVSDAVSGGEQATPDPAPKSQEAPKSAANVSAVRSLPKEEVTLKLKAGDWSMKVGRILEIVSLHNVVNGNWYITKEEHSVDTDGFQTTVTCRKARSSEVRAYGASKVKARTGTSKPKSGSSDADQKSKAQESTTPIQVISSEEQAKQNRQRLNEIAAAKGRAEYGF